MVMERTRRNLIKGFVFIGAFLWLLPLVANADPHKLTCGKEKTIGEALHELKPGDTLVVSGTCNENLVIPEEVRRITLDGQGTATIDGPDAALNTVLVRGTGITIRRFQVTGGRSGIQVEEGGTAQIDSNIIRNTGRHGISVNRHSSAEIVNNTIQNNPGNGIFVSNHSHARIGFEGPPPGRILKPNVIENNGEQGIFVGRSSYGKIIGNVIRNNTGSTLSGGIFIGIVSHADINGNTINGNGGDGIRVQENSGANIGTDSTGATATVDDDTNTGNNAGFGIKCRVDGYASGNMGSLAGTLAAQGFSQGCFDNVSL